MINLNVIKLKDGEFYELTDIIKNQAGIFFRKSKKYLLEYKLTPRLRELNFNSFSDYIYYLKYPVLNKRELDKLISLITICETYFFRERAQFDYMINDLIPNLVKDGKRNFKIWSAACSTGEEIYSIVILLKENMLLNRYNFEFFASDVNNKALEIAKYGEYKKNSFRGDIDNSIINKYFIVKDNRYKLKDEIRKKVKFYKLNLIDYDIIKYIYNIDFIFCRNVLIYFDVDMKKRVLDIMYNVLNIGGSLFLGHAETISKLTDKFSLKNFNNGSLYIKRG